MTTTDITFLCFMVTAAMIAVFSFSVIFRHLCDRGLANPDDRKPDLLAIYKSYLDATKKQNGRIGGAFWIHCLSAGGFIAAGVAYTLFRFLLPRLF